MPTNTNLRAHAIDRSRLAQVLSAGNDGHGNDVVPFLASGQGEPLRCCLRYARADELIALISFAPFTHPSVWTEVGPVYVHAKECPGYQGEGLPADLNTEPRVLRTYRADDSMNYEHNTLVADGEDLTVIAARLLSFPDVATVHVRTVLPQCFLYAVTAA